MDSPPPDLLNWAFWFKDSASVRDLLVALAAPGAVITAAAALRQASIASKRHVEQTNADRERRISDSFIKAIELLGSNKLESRLGAIYALEDISSQSERHYWPIIETLTAYVRTNSPAEKATQSDQNRSSDQVASAYAVAVAEGTTEADQITAQASLPRLAVDIQAVLTVLNRRTSRHEKRGQRIDLSGANLSVGDLIGGKLSGASLVETDLSEADLSQADLSGAYLCGAKLNGAHFNRTDLREANLLWANLSEANLSEANLFRANLRGADLENAKFCKTTMPDGTVNNRDCPPEPTPPSPSETPPAPD
jgi:Pentapeptide repeats (8 copies)